MGKFYTWTRWQRFRAWLFGTCLGCEHCGRCHASWEKKCQPTDGPTKPETGGTA